MDRHEVSQVRELGQWIKARCGLQFIGKDESRLQEAVSIRCEVSGVPSSGYMPHVMADEEEFQALINLLTINETYFFREPEQLQWLVETLIPQHLSKHDKNTPLRIFFAGCSSGEEPFSVVMALIGRYGEHVSRLFRFIATDIDSQAIAKARTGRYGEFSFRGVDSELRERFFTLDQGKYRLCESVRQQVVFHEMNLLSDQRPSAIEAEMPVDIVIFRNVSIYFDDVTRRLAQTRLAALLKDQGVLIVGLAETLANDLGILPLVDDGGMYYFVKGGETRPRTVLPVKPAGSSPVQTAFMPVAPPAPLVVPSGWKPPVTDTFNEEACRRQILQLLQEKRFTEAKTQLDTWISHAQDRVEARILLAFVQLEQQEFAAASALSKTVLEQEPWLPDAFFVLGQAARWQSLDEEAAGWFKQAIYAEHTCWPAHYHLADLQRRAGALEAARRAYRSVIQLTSKPPPIPSGLQFLPMNLPTGEMAFLCEKQLARLELAMTEEGRG